MRLAPLICAAAFIAAPGFAQEDSGEMARMEDGVWRIVTNLSLTGQVLGEELSDSETETSEECIEGDDATLLDQTMSDDTCEMTPVSQDSHSLSATMICAEDDLVLEGEVSVRLSPARDILYGTIYMGMNEGIISMDANGEIWGQWLRACGS